MSLFKFVTVFLLLAPGLSKEQVVLLRLCPFLGVAVRLRLGAPPRRVPVTAKRRWQFFQCLFNRTGQGGIMRQTHRFVKYPKGKISLKSADSAKEKSKK